MLVRREPQPLDDEELGDFVEEGFIDLIVFIDGEPYNSEDLRACDGCELYYLEEGLDDDLLCEECAKEAAEWAEGMRQLRSDYYASVL